jgi:hypothetical protein
MNKENINIEFTLSQIISKCHKIEFWATSKPLHVSIPMKYLTYLHNSEKDNKYNLTKTSLFCIA